MRRVSRKTSTKSKSGVFRNIGILVKENDSHAQSVFEQLFPQLLRIRRQGKIFLEPSVAKLAGSSKGVLAEPLDRLLRKIDLLLVIGGDGTILKAARHLLAGPSWKRVQLLGINTGHTGFLSFLSPSAAASALQQILLRPEVSTTEHHSCLKAQIDFKKGKSVQFHALNDCVLSKGNLSRLFEFHVEVDGQFLSSYRSDGLIISTPTGSTAYNLAAGGAILQPEIPALQLTPICPQSFSNKPIVIADSKRIVLSLGRHSTEVYMTIDGHTAVEVDSGDRMSITKSEKRIQFLIPADSRPSHYFQSLRQKLKWGTSLAFKSTT